jgi:hypothetical protein
VQRPWRRHAEAKATLAPASGVPLVVRATQQPLTIERIDLKAPDAVGDGASSYALQVVDAAQVRVRHATLEAGKGADGAPGAPGADGGLRACHGAIDCSTGEKGSPGSNGASGEEGEYGESGYEPKVAWAGVDGSPGKNGTVAPIEEERTYKSCWEIFGCGPIDETAYGLRGSCGCGSEGGRGGQAGHGGGATLGVYVYAKPGASSTSLSLESLIVTTRGGGIGGKGGLGGGTATGSHGTTGPSVPYREKGCVEVCTQPCGSDGSCCNFALKCEAVGPEQTIPGTLGGPGAPGGAGGKGGGGAGGPSIALVTVGEVAVTLTDTTLTPGVGGPGADGAPSGEAHERLDL